MNNNYYLLFFLLKIQLVILHPRLFIVAFLNQPLAAMHIDVEVAV